MKNRGIPTVFALAALAALFGGCAGALPGRLSQPAGARPDGPDWANRSLNMIIEKYGRPDSVETNRVVWEKKGPWKRIVVWDDMGVGLGLGQMSRAADNNIEEIIAYLVPEDKRRAVEGFSGRLKVSADGAELSARSPSEDGNFLALNLADDIIHGIRTPEQAKAFDAATLKAADAGTTSPYLKGLLFHPEPPPLPQISGH